MRVREAQWAAQVPWNGIQDKPTFLDGPDGQILISDVKGLQAALAAKQDRGGLARVAYTGNYADLNGKPVFGSAAFTDVSQYARAYTGRIVTGTTDTITGNDYYIVGNNAVGLTVTLLDATLRQWSVFKFKNKGAGDMTLDATGLGQIFTDTPVDTLVLATGDMVTLTSDGSTWLVGD